MRQTRNSSRRSSLASGSGQNLGDRQARGRLELATVGMDGRGGQQVAVENVGGVSGQLGVGDDPRSFEDHFRSLVIGSLQRSVAAESELQHALGHRRRALRAARRATDLERLLSPSEAEAADAPRRALERMTRVVVVATILILLAVARIAGVTSAWTGAADVALIGVTVAWFLVESRPPTRATTGELAAGEVDTSMPRHSAG
jgi:hypothetical protein